MSKYVTIKCPNCGNEMYADESKINCECTNCRNMINISGCIVKGQAIINENDLSNKNVNDANNSTLLNSLKTGLFGAFDTVKTESKKAIDDAKENMLRSAEERKKDKEEKLKEKLAEKERQARLKLETEKKIRQMKRDAEERKRQEKEQRKAIERAKRKAFFGKIKVLFIIIILCFAAYRIYQLVDYNLQTERQKQLKIIEMDKQRELAEIEARRQIEIASITEAEKKKRHDKNEFDVNKNEKISIRLFDFSVPIYWNENKKNINAYDGLAEVGGKIAELQISSLEDTDIVSFDVLKKETLNGNMQNVFTQSGWFEGATFIEYERIIKVFCFPSFEDNRWYYVVLQESSNTSYSYITDFYKIINSIKRNVNSAVKE